VGVTCATATMVLCDCVWMSVLERVGSTESDQSAAPVLQQ